MSFKIMFMFSAEECNETIGCKIGEICNDSRCGRSNC